MERINTMPKLNDILSGILCNLNDSRLVADIHSRRISSVYKQDPMLKSFSTPRAQIKEFELDLTCAITGINADEHFYLEDETVAVYDILASTLTTSLINKTIKMLVEEQFPQEQIDHINGLETELIETLLTYLNAGGLIDIRGDIDVRSADIDIFSLYKSFISNKNTDDITINVVDLDINNTIGLLIETELISWFQSTLATLNTTTGVGLEVEVAVDRLLQRPENILCKLRLKGDYRNYIWRESIDIEGVASSILVEE